MTSLKNLIKLGVSASSHGLTDANENVKLTQRNQKGKSHRTHPNGINGTDVNEVKIKVLIKHCLSLDGLKRPPCWPPILKDIRQACSIHPSLKKFKRSGPKNHTEKPDQQFLKETFRLVNQVKG